MLDVFVALVLNQIARRRANQRAGERMMTVNQCTRSGADQCAARLAVVFPVIRCRRVMTTMMRARERCVGGNE